MYSHNMKNLLIALLTLFFCATSFALSDTAKTYDIEVLIFSHITPQTLQSEDWPPLSAAELSEFTQNTAMNTADTTSQRSALALQHEKKSLTRTLGYHILVDRSWRRSFSSEASTISIPVSNGAQLTGTITVELTHYFNVHTNLLLTEPTKLLQQMDTRSYFANGNQPTVSFQVSQNRRMKSNELNYLGHPLLGVLIKILPVKN